MTDTKQTPGPWSVTKDGKHVCGPVGEDGTKPSVARYTNQNGPLIADAGTEGGMKVLIGCEISGMNRPSNPSTEE